MEICLILGVISNIANVTEYPEIQPGLINWLIPKGLKACSEKIKKKQKKKKKQKTKKKKKTCPSNSGWFSTLLYVNEYPRMQRKPTNFAKKLTRCEEICFPPFCLFTQQLSNHSA